MRLRSGGIFNRQFITNVLRYTRQQRNSEKRTISDAVVTRCLSTFCTTLYIYCLGLILLMQISH